MSEPIPMPPEAAFRWTELDAATWPAWRDGILEADAASTPGPPRSYPGYPRWLLPRPGGRLWPSLDRVLARRRCTKPGAAQPSRRVLGRLLGAAHGITGDRAAGPVPSAGGLQALELYLAVLAPGWLPAGAYHYDRVGHHLSQVVAKEERAGWEKHVPSLERLGGGGLLWLIAGDGARVQARYGARGLRFLLLEAGHLMQNLCLLSTSLGLVTVPLGGFFERALRKALGLPETDLLLYVGACG
jgi:SagB-type dehydrogenase family enzyme